MYLVVNILYYFDSSESKLLGSLNLSLAIMVYSRGEMNVKFSVRIV